MDFKTLSKRALEIRKLYQAFEKAKYGKEWSNLNLMEGLMGDVGDLMKLAMAKEGIREGEGVDQKLTHELSDCLWSLLVLAHNYGIDLESSFLVNMEELEKKLMAENSSRNPS